MNKELPNLPPKESNNESAPAPEENASENIGETQKNLELLGSEASRAISDAVKVTEELRPHQERNILDFGGSVKEAKNHTAHIDQKIEEVKQEALEGIQSWTKLQPDHQFDPENFYRTVDEKGYKDFEDTNIVRSSLTGTDPIHVNGFDVGSRPTSFPSFDKGVPNMDYTREGENNYIFESSNPMVRRGDINPINGNIVKGRHWAYRPIDKETGDVIQQMTPEMIKDIYKVDPIGELYKKNNILNTPDSQEK